MSYGDYILKELKKLSPNFGLVVKADNALIRCPFHKNGNETHPSLHILLRDKSKWKAGFCRCFSCSYKGAWKGLASQLKLQALTGSALSDTDEYVPQLTQQNAEQEEVDQIEDLDLVEWRGDWRGIKEKTLLQVGAKLHYSKKIDDIQLYLPSYVLGEKTGHIVANIVKRGKNNYFNSGGEFTSVTLWPYDVVAKMIKKHKYKAAVLVEGPRDALRLLQFNIPALAILGASAFNDYKVNLLLGLGIDFVITAYDGDDAGRSVGRITNALLKGHIPCGKFGMEEGSDPAAMPIERVIKLRSFVKAKSGL